MLKIASDFYKNLFKKDERVGFSLADDLYPKSVSSEDNSRLESPFSEEEIKKAIFDSYSDGAPGPDGIPFIFYQHFWDLVKHDLMNMFDDFHSGRLDIFRLNFAMLTLVPKEADATVMKKFRPISLLNCVFKIFTKVLTNRLALIMDKLVASNQTAFIKGRYIPESVVTAHEAIHSLSRSKSKGVALKIDYEKAFDRVDLDFLEELLRKRGFGPKWISWIMQITHGGSVGVKLNNCESDFFITSRGLR